MCPVEVIEQPRNTYHNTVLCSKSINMNNLEDIAGKKSQDKQRRNKVKHWSPLPFDWLKWNINPDLNLAFFFDLPCLQR